MPGMFCDAIVTRNNGIAIPIIAVDDQIGVTRTGFANHVTVSPALPWNASSSTVTATAAGTAYSRQNRQTMAHVRMTGSARVGVMATARIGARHRFSSTPASIALASEDGIAATARPNGRQRPAITISTPLSRNAPTAAWKPPSGSAEDASSAPPGVDHDADGFAVPQAE